MRRIALLLATASAALALPAVIAGAAGTPTVPTLGVRVASCETTASVGSPVATFRGTMPAIPGAALLEMRFVLEQRMPRGWSAVTLAGFERWERAAPGAVGFVYDKRVQRLAPGSAYRVRVRFRWSAPDGTVLRRARRVSGVCRVAAERPDVSLDGLTVAPLPDGRARYVVQVHNGALTAALGLVRVGLTVDGVVQPAQTLSGLPADTLASVAFEGPACRPGGSILARIDPQDGLDADEQADNTLELACPSPA